MGPKATAMPEVAPQMPSAFWRSDGSVKMSVRMASEAGNTNAAATPISARAEISAPVLWLTAARTEKAPKNARPTCMTGLRPSRSPTPPPARSRPAKVRL